MRRDHRTAEVKVYKWRSVEIQPNSFCAVKERNVVLIFQDCRDKPELNVKRASVLL